MSLTLAREIAYDAFVDIMTQKRHADDTLELYYQRHEKQLKRLDRNFVKEIVYGGLRWYSKIFWILQNTASRDLRETSQQVQAALVLGTYQIFYMDRVPDRAAVNESVEYLRKKSQANACPFVNGILRQIARRAEYFAKPDKVTEASRYLALQYAHPQWIIERWQALFSFERLEVILSSNNQPPPHYVRANFLKTPAAEIHLLQQQLLREEKTHSEKRPLRCSLALREFPNLEPDSLFGRGFYTIQDEASQLIGYLAAPQPKEKVIDACAGPGGKLTHLFELSQGEAVITACENHAEQMAKAKSTAGRIGALEAITWVDEDFLNWRPKGKIDKVLLDAPCSGLGVLRRHPEGKWQKTSDLIGAMATEQRAFITHALDILKDGGELIYSVCSFEPEETVRHLQWLQGEHADRIEVISPVARLPDYYKRYVTRENMLFVFSGNQDNMDGFGAFIVRVKAVA